ncbi:hypothetical protein O3G_MSEX011761 [Manduca sexta]|uniref:THIF-type NAD/FAD binding fold domain-containing protein n=1 Tax=Manduca sexta TaxID=7130 RepID=A0A921ZLN9_MANSE|nr:hypothetical protein O3G_MSEX011761 [Manduca sexta]
MDRVSVLEQEIADLRKVLHEKETELYQIKNGWVMRQLTTPVEPERQNYNNSGVQYSGNLPKWAIERYSRQILLPDIGVAGQEKLCKARVLVVGAGGLGCPASVYLAGAGVGEIGIVDYDTVDVTNIHRQILHYERDEHVSKAESAAQTLRSINSRIKVTPYSIQLDSTNAMQVAANYDIILDCSDNVPTRYLLNDLSVMLKIPLISGSALQMEGQLTIYGYRANNNPKEMNGNYTGPCYRCVFPTPPPPEAVGSCSTNGVAGPIPGVIGALQALEAIKYIVGHSHSGLLVERMLLFDGDDTTFRTVKLRPRNSECAACSDTPSICQLLDYETVCKTQAKEKKKEDTLKSERRKLEKDKRMSGQSYYGFRVKADGTKKWVQDVPKSERRLGPRCKSELCAKGTSRKCSMITETDRMDMFRHFWNDLDWREKKAHVRSLVDTVPAKRRRLKHKGDVSRKGDSKRYHLRSGGERMPVCRVMFLNTLGIKEAMVRSWLSSSDRPKTPKKALKALNVNTFIDRIPKMAPNCKICSKNKEYIAIDNVTNLHQLYNLYVRECAVQGSVPASRKTFSKVITTRNVKMKNVCECITQNVWENQMHVGYSV